MTDSQQQLFLKLKEFISILEKSGRVDTAKYFTKLESQLENETMRQDALQRLISSGSISQYANLSDFEVSVFDHLLQKAIELKESGF